MSEPGKCWFIAAALVLLIETRVSAQGNAPVITGQPANVTVYSGMTASFTAGVTGTALDYQWQFNGTDLPGATNNPLSLTNVQVSQAGNYALVVSNAAGSAVSSNAVLAVSNSKPIFALQPTNQAVLAKWDTAFSTLATGSQPVSYQWRFNGSDIAGATDPALTITNAQFDHGGNYSVVVTNAYGSVTSTNALLEVANSLVRHWGIVNQYFPVPPGVTNVVQVAAGKSDRLALKRDGTVARWGTSAPTGFPPGLSNVVAIAAQEHCLALKNNGTIVAWGDNTLGQINTPTGLSNVVAVATGRAFSLALKSDGSVRAWGFNWYGQTDVPVDLTNVVAISAGAEFSMALKDDGTVVAWGHNVEGNTDVPAGLTNVVAISAGGALAMALKDDGTLVTWGSPLYNQANTLTGLTNIVAIRSGGGDAIMIKRDGTMAASGIIGITAVGSPAPTDLTNVVGAACGSSYNLFLMDAGVSTLPVMGTGWSNNFFNLSISTLSGRIYALEFKDSLNASEWTALPLVAGSGAVKVLADLNTNGSQRFYRVRQW
jgi:Regulator of chromosome condensation (RCC1) repeat/Immunoglobulin I-set domain